MNQSNLKIGATFDKVNLDEGFSQSGQTAQQWSDKLNILFNSVGGTSKRALKAISDDTKSMAATVTTEQKRIAEATRAVAIANNDVRQSMVLLKAGTVDGKTEMDLLAASQQKTAVAAHELKAALDAVAGPQHKAVTDVQATSAAIRSLEGNPGIRALENFLAKTLNLGPAMSAIFPLIGAYAFGKILFDVGEKAYDLEQKAAHSGKAIAEAFEDAHEKAQVANDELQITNDKLQDQIDKLSGHPNNGLVTALDEARKMADKLLVSMQADRKELEALLKEHEVGALGSMLSGVASTVKQAKELEADQARLTEAMEAADDKLEEESKSAKGPQAIAEAGRRRNQAVARAIQAEIDTYRTETERLKREQVVSESAREADIVSGGTGNGGIDNTSKIGNIKGRILQLRDIVRTLQGEALTPELQSKVGQLKQDRADKPGRDTEAEDQFRAQEAALNQMKIDGPMSAKQIYEFWEVQKTAFEKGSRQYDAIVAKQAELAVQSSNKIHEEIKRIRERDKSLAAEGTAAFNRSENGIAKWVKETTDDINQAGPRWDAYWREATRGQEILASIDEEQRSANLAMLLATGALTPLAFAQREAGLHAQMHASRITALREELERLEKVAKRNPATGNVIDPRQAQQITSVRNQIAQEQGKAQVQGIGDAAKIQQQVVTPYKKAFDRIAADFNRTVNSILMGQESIGQGARKMAANELATGAQELLQLGEKHLAHYLFVDMLHIGSAAKKAAVDASASSAQVATAVTTNTATALSYAAVAGAAAFASTAAIPVIGPALAPVAAAAAYAGAATFAPMAAFEQGTMHVPRAGVAMLHPGEAVLGSPGAQVMRDVLSGGGSGGGRSLAVNFNGSHQFSGAPESFPAQWSAHEDYIVSRLKSLRRSDYLD